MTNAQWNSPSDRPSFNLTYIKIAFLIGCLILCVLRLNSWNLEGFLVRKFILWLHKAAEFLAYPSDVQALVEEYVPRRYTSLNFPFHSLIGFGSVLRIDYFEVCYWLLPLHRGEGVWGKGLYQVTAVFSLLVIIYNSQLNSFLRRKTSCSVSYIWWSSRYFSDSEHCALSKIWSDGTSILELFAPPQA